MFISYCCRDDLPQTQCCRLLPEFWRSEVKTGSHWTKIKVSARLPSLWGLQEEFASPPFPVSGSHLHPWLVDPFHLASTDVLTLTSASIIPPPLTLTLLPPFCKDPCPLQCCNLGPSPHHKRCNIIMSVKSLLGFPW